MSCYTLGIILTLAFAKIIFHSTDAKYCQQKIWNSLKPTYNPETSPSDRDTVLNVTIGITILELIALDEPKESLITALMATTFWKDPRLTWNSSQAGFDNCERMRLPASSVYLPDIHITNGHTFTHLFDTDSRVNVDSNGQMSWFTMGVASTGCTIDLTFYPFDYQTCFIYIQCISEQFQDLRIWPQSETVNLDHYRQNSVWDLVDSRMVRTKFYQSDAIKVYFRLRRKPLYYLFNVAIPVIILSAMTLLVFCMPPQADEKMGYVVTVFLSYTVFTSQISNSVPVSSEAAPLLGEYTMLSLIYSSMAIVATASVASLFHTPPNERPNCIIMLLLHLINCSLFSPQSHKRSGSASTSQLEESSALASDNTKRYDGTKSTSSIAEEDGRPSQNNGASSENTYWQQMAVKLDAFYFWLFFAVNLVTIILCLVIIPFFYRRDAENESWLPEEK